jgi:hypothetical protein
MLRSEGIAQSQPDFMGAAPATRRGECIDGSSRIVSRNRTTSIHRERHVGGLYDGRRRRCHRHRVILRRTASSTAASTAASTASGE